MCALAVFLERAGIATVVVGLTRLHIEKIRPPRALWVPFAMGRPLGGPTTSGSFKKEVLRTALRLLESQNGPQILEDFPKDDAGGLSDVTWKPPDVSLAVSLTDEVNILLPLWQRSVAQLGRSMTGLSGLPIETAADYLQRFDTDNPADNPGTDQSDLLRMRFSADDIKTFYAEAALANGSPGSEQIGDWFWSETHAAATLHRIRQQNLDSTDKLRATVCGRLLVPGARLTG